MARPNRRAEILGAASIEFREHGYENATLERIGARLGILKGSIYHYVSSKEELLYAVAEEPAHSLVSELRRLGDERRAGAPVIACIREFFRIQVSIFATHYPAAFVYMSRLGPSSERAEFVEIDREQTEMLEGLLADGVAAGEISLSTAPHVAALALIGMLDSMQHWFTPRGVVEDVALADDMFAMALGGVLAGAGARACLGSAASAQAPQNTPYVTGVPQVRT